MSRRHHHCLFNNKGHCNSSQQSNESETTWQLPQPYEGLLNSKAQKLLKTWILSSRTDIDQNMIHTSTRAVEDSKARTFQDHSFHAGPTFCAINCSLMGLLSLCKPMLMHRFRGIFTNRALLVSRYYDSETEWKQCSKCSGMQCDTDMTFRLFYDNAYGLGNGWRWGYDMAFVSIEIQIRR